MQLIYLIKLTSYDSIQNLLQTKILMLPHKVKHYKLNNYYLKLTQIKPYYSNKRLQYASINNNLCLKNYNNTGKNADHTIKIDGIKSVRRLFNYSLKEKT